MLLETIQNQQEVITMQAKLIEKLAAELHNLQTLYNCECKELDEEINEHNKQVF